MKTVLLIRHAKSDWPEGVDDFDRPLTDYGRENAHEMATFLKKENIQIDQFISSPANRAETTCSIFAKIFEKNYSTERQLYNPREIHFENIIYGLDNSVDTIALFSHNNGISNFANYLTDEIINLPTCGVAAYQIDCKDWADFEISKKKLAFFQSPKILHKLKK